MEKFPFLLWCILALKITKARYMTTLEEHIKKILKVLIYIEEHIEEELTIEQHNVSRALLRKDGLLQKAVLKTAE